MVENIKYSIIITTYNYANYIRECIDSCLNQNDNISYEIIVVNDGSTDNTEDILSEYNHQRLSSYTIENSGIERASNFGINKAKGSYIVRVDADDLLLEDYLETLDGVVNESKPIFYYSNYNIIDKYGATLEEMSLPDFSEDEIMSRGDFLATGTLYRKKDLEKIGLYSEEIKNTGLENYELTLKLLGLGVTGVKISKPLFCYRRHNLNMSEVKREKIIAYGNQLLRRFNDSQFTTNKYHPYKLKLE